MAGAELAVASLEAKLIDDILPALESRLESRLRRAITQTLREELKHALHGGYPALECKVAAAISVVFAVSLVRCLRHVFCLNAPKLAASPVCAASAHTGAHSRPCITLSALHCTRCAPCHLLQARS